MYGFYRLKQEKDVLICWRRFTNRYKNYDADCSITPLATKTRRSICTRPTVTKIFDKLSKAVSVKHTSYNWRNSEATYLILLTRYCSLDIQRNLFHRKTHFVWYETSVWFLLSVICTIANSLERFDSNEKLQPCLSIFENSILGLKFEYI